MRTILHQSISNATAYVRHETNKKIGDDTTVIFGLDGRSEDNISDAIKCGFRTFDAANSYPGCIDNLSTAINKAITATKDSDKPIRREDFEIIYKVDLEDSKLEEHLTTVAQKLNGKIDHVLIHNASNSSPKCWDMLKELKAEGMLIHIGAGNVNHENIGRYIEGGADSFEIRASSLLLEPNSDELNEKLKQVSDKPVFIYGLHSTLKNILKDEPTPQHYSALLYIIENRSNLQHIHPIMSSRHADRSVENFKMGEIDQYSGPVQEAYKALKTALETPKETRTVVAMSDDSKSAVGKLIEAKDWAASNPYQDLEPMGNEIPAFDHEAAKFYRSEEIKKYSTEELDKVISVEKGCEKTLGELLTALLTEDTNCKRVAAYEALTLAVCTPATTNT